MEAGRSARLRSRLSKLPLRRLALGALAALALYAALGFLAVPALVRSKLPAALSTKLHRPVTLKGARFNPFALSLTLEGLSIGDRAGPGTLLSVERLYVNAEASSIVRRGVVFRQVAVEAPHLSVTRNEDGTTSIQDILDEALAPKPDEKPSRFSVGNITVERGEIDVDDRLTKTRHAVRDLSIGIPFLSNLPVDVDVFTRPRLAAKVNGAPFELEGRSKPFAGSRETSVSIDLADVDLPYYLAYIPRPGEAHFASAKLDTALEVTFRESKGTGASLVLSGTAALRDVEWVDAAKAPLLRWSRLDLSLAPTEPLLRRVRFRRVALTGPEVWITRDRASGYPIAEKFLGKAPPGKSGGGAGGAAGTRPKVAEAPWQVDVASIAVEGGRIHYRDEQPKVPFEALVKELKVAVTGLTTRKASEAAFTASAATDGGEAVDAKGTFSLDPQSARGELKLTGVPLKRYETYLRDTARFDFEEGTVDLATKFRWPVDGGGTAVSELAVDARAVRARIRGEREDFLRIPSLALKGTEIDPAKRTVTVGELTLTKPFLRAVRKADGGVDLSSLTPPAPAATGGTETAAPPAAPYTTRVGTFVIDAGTLRFVDEAAPRPTTVVLSPASTRVEGLSTVAGEKAKLSSQVVVNGKGTVSGSGTVGISPPSAELKLQARGVELVPLAGYVPARVLLRMTGGTVSAAGTVTAKVNPDGRTFARWSGDLSFDRFGTVDPATSESFLGWSSLFLEGMDASVNPDALSIRKVAATDLFTRIELYTDGTLNYRKVFGLAEPPPVDEAEVAAAEGATAAPVAPAAGPAAAPPAATAPANAATAAVTPVRIDAITLQNASIHVDDTFVKPNYRADLKEVGGRISGLSSESGTRAEVELRGSLESSAPIEVKGSLNPLAATKFADIKASFRDIDLVPFTTYFVKYAGYAVQKGRLTMNVEYKLDDRRLQAKNGFVVDQFTFGDKVESPTATKLPVKLAISLLKDPDGVIRLDVPISGSVDDPKFRIGPIVWKIIGNILVKAVTSPFKLLGSLFGGGQELSRVDFAPGLATLDATATGRLDALAKALAQRPALKLDVEGKADAEKDPEGLKRALFERKVKARKAEELARKGAAVPVDDVVVSKEEWPEYLERAYRKEKFPKPRTALGFVKKLPPEEMEKLMLTNIQVGPDDLRQLALERATAVKDYLLSGGKVAADRVFLVEPGAARKPKPGETLARVDFVLK